MCVQPAAHSWSLGQLYLHLINDTWYYIDQIKACLSGNDNAHREISAEARALFLQNSFPDKKIAGHPDNAFIPQPDSKDSLMFSLLQLSDEMIALEKLIIKAVFNGKTAHPGFKYLGAAEWFQLADMHFRHHLRQKKRIDEFLAGRKPGNSR